MKNSNFTTRIFLGAALAAFVTVGCGGGGGGSPAAPAPAPTSGTGGNGDTTGGTTTGGGTTAGGTDSGTTQPPAPAAPHSGHHRCGWIGADTFDAGKASFLANPDYYDAIHPKWGTAKADGTVTILP